MVGVCLRQGRVGGGARVYSAGWVLVRKVRFSLTSSSPPNRSVRL